MDIKENSINSKTVISVKIVISILALLIFILFCISVNIGNYPVGPVKIAYIIMDVFTGLFEGKYDINEKIIILSIRIPRIIMAIIAGAGLAVSGATCQGIFRNPLVSPFIIGISAGASFGAAFAIVFFNQAQIYIEMFSMLFGFIASGTAYYIAREKNGNVPMINLVLAGIVVSSIFSSFVGLLKYIADTDTQLPAITFWMMGGLDSIGWDDFFPNVPVIIFCVIFLWFFSWKINLLSLGEKEARSLGVNIERIKFILILLVVACASSIVSRCGIIGWIGLVIPHMARYITGPDNTCLIPVSALMGSLVLLISDDLARSVTSGEIPIGIITSLIGAPFFIWLLKKRKDESWK